MKLVYYDKILRYTDVQVKTYKQTRTQMMSFAYVIGNLISDN